LPQPASSFAHRDARPVEMARTAVNAVATNICWLQLLQTIALVCVFSLVIYGLADAFQSVFQHIPNGFNPIQMATIDKVLFCYE
jgi:hypothetical protein